MFSGFADGAFLAHGLVWQVELPKDILVRGPRDSRSA